ncbi:MAG: hypothetical protein J5967_04815 [Oscillospiraceae bacterium]|nr:hypothetical protein [Oscillospiraceae bacterium]
MQLNAAPTDGQTSQQAGGTQPDGQGTPQDTPTPSLTVAGETVDLTANSGGSGWSYDAQDNSVVLINYDGSTQSITTTASDVTIKAAGLNRLEKLSVDGDIHLIGTGILLVDEIEMAEGKSFDLQPNKEIYGENGGSVAVFLKQEDGSYRLINGSIVSGILDEEYTLPAGVTLVVPDGSELRLQSLAVGELLAEGAPVQVEYSTVGETEAERPLLATQTERRDAGLDPGTVEFWSTAAQLTIPETAKLIVENAAKLVLSQIYELHSGTLVSKMTVAGSLELDGTVSGGVVVLERGNVLSGNGVIQNAEINAHASQTGITASDSKIILGDKTETGTLALSGQNEIQFGGNAEVGTLELNQGGVSAASFETLDEDGNQSTLHVDTISGSGAITYQNGNIEIGTNSSGGKVTETFTTGGIIVRNAGTDQEELFVVGPSGPILVSGSGAEFSNGYYSFPLVKVFVGGSRNVDGSITESVSPNGEDAEIMCSFGAGSTTISLNELRSTLLPTVGIGKWIEIYYADDSGKLQRRILTDKDQLEGETMDASCISLIRTVAESYVTNGSGGGSSTSTNTSFTGSGVLGAGAGSVKGGKSTSILSGTGITNPTPTNNGENNPGGNPGSNTGGNNTGGNNTGGNNTGGDNTSGNNTGGNNTGGDNTGGDNTGGNNTGGENTGSTDPDDNGENGAGKTDESGTNTQNGGTEEPGTAMRIWVDRKNPKEAYVLHAEKDGVAYSETADSIQVRMSFTPAPEMTGHKLYVVFLDRNGKPQAFAAHYDKESKELVFETELLGKFTVVAFDFSGKEFSPEFYTALAKLEEVKKLS